MFHKSNDHPASNESVANVSTYLEMCETEVYATFTNFQETLMRPYTSGSGNVDAKYYEQMLPIAAQLTMAATTLAAAECTNKGGVVNEFL